MQSEEVPFRRNIILFYFITLFSGLAFIYDLILVIYYESFGLSLFQVSVILITVSIFTLVFEVPSGAFADLHGRKKSLVISSFAFFLSFLIILLFTNFAGFMIAAAILGISIAFNSGAESALVYDSLKKLGRKKDYLKIKARFATIFLIATLFTAFFGPYLYSINKFIPVLLTVIFSPLELLFIFWLREPKKAQTKHKSFLKEHLKQMKSGFSYVLKHYKVLWLALFSAVFYLFCNAIGEFLEVPYFLDLGFVVRQVSYISVISLVIQIIISRGTEKLEKKIGENNSFLLIILIPGIALFLSQFFHSYLIGIFIGLFWGFSMFRELIVDNYMNKHIKKGNRATVLSVSSMMLSLVTVMSFPLLGWLADTSSPKFSIIVISGLILILGLTFYSVKIKKKL